ncbi:MAG: CHASE2 domain-containing protein [Proteobacteria bacterium]|nr:CHASE2 domain-containing protein [Pseudomonadota bacterium]
MLRKVGQILRSRLAAAIGVSVLVAIVVFTVAWVFRDLPFFGDQIAESRGVAMAIRADTEAPQVLQAPLLLIAIDEDAYVALGRPDHTPHDRIGLLLRRLATVHPLLVILDLDINGTAGSAENAVLDAALDRVGEEGLPLLLLRQPVAGATPEMPYRLLRSPFDATVERHASLRWMIANAPASEHGEFRRMLSFMRLCAAGRPVFVAGVAVRAANAYQAAITGRPARLAFPAPDWSCTPGAARTAGPVTLAAPLILGGRSVWGLAPSETVRYTMKWPGGMTLSEQTVSDRTGRARPLYTVLPAAPYLAVSNSGSGDLVSWARDAIVVIGATHDAARDVHPTPLGEMPGSFIIVNHLRGMIDLGPEGDTGWWPALVLTLFLSLVSAVATVTLERYLASWVEVLLPIVITAVWWIVLTLVSGGPGYFALALTQLIVVFVVRLVPKDRNQPLRGGRA